MKIQQSPDASLHRINPELFPSFLKNSPPSIDAENLARVITQRLGAIVKNLRVSINDLSVVISGVTGSYYNKQAVSFTALTYIGATYNFDREVFVTNEIEITD